MSATAFALPPRDARADRPTPGIALTANLVGQDALLPPGAGTYTLVVMLMVPLAATLFARINCGVYMFLLNCKSFFCCHDRPLLMKLVELVKWK